MDLLRTDPYPVYFKAEHRTFPRPDRPLISKLMCRRPDVICPDSPPSCRRRGSDGSLKLCGFRQGFPPSSRARMEGFHFFPSGSFSKRKRSIVDVRIPSAMDLLIPFTSSSAIIWRRLIKRRLSPVTFTCTDPMSYQPFIVSLENKRCELLIRKPLPAACSCVSPPPPVPIMIVPFATPSRNLIADWYLFR